MKAFLNTLGWWAVYPGSGELTPSSGRWERLGRLRRSGSLDSDPDVFKAALSSNAERGEGGVLVVLERHGTYLAKRQHISGSFS